MEFAPRLRRKVGPGRYVPAMGFPALHRLLGRRAGPLTNDMLDVAIVGGVRETDDLDWKSELPEAKDPSQSDVVKDVAAMANSGGGMIVFGSRKRTRQPPDGRAWASSTRRTSAPSVPLS